MESITGRVAANTFWLMFQRVTGRVISFLLMIYLARHLGSLNFGKFTFASSFVGLFLVLADLGITTLVVREVARDKERGSQYFGGTAVLKVFLSVIAFIVIAVGMYLMKVPSDTRTIVLLIGACSIFENAGVFFSAIFQAYEKMSYLAVIEIIEKSFLVFLCFIFLSKGFGLTGIGFAYFFSGIFFCVINIVLVSLRFFKPVYRIDFKFWKDVLRESVPLAIIVAISMIYYNTDIVMLGKMKGEEVAAWYGVSYHLFLAVGMFAGAFLSAVFPVMSKFSVESQGMLKKSYEKSFKLIFGMGLPFSVAGVLLAQNLITFLFGVNYEHSVVIFRTFSFIIVFSYLNGLAGYFLTATNRQTLTVKILALVTGLNVILNFILIPHYSYNGAAFATVVSEVLFFTIFFFSLPSEFRYFPWQEIVKSAVSSAIMGFVTVLLIKNGINVFIVIAAALTLYFFLIWITGYITEEEKLEFKNFFLRRE